MIFPRSFLDPLVAASAIEDLVGILYEEYSVRQICVCQTLIRENDAVFNARVKALTKYLKVLLEPIPYCFFWGHRGFWNTSQRYHLLISYLLIWFLFQTKPRVLSPCGLAGCSV